ncbi:hypothetical protein Ocin01_13255 [Orchesella cincta]|uniref:Uncharacterized protein n=1 Tax=Orchesella cincta TaxID=48709 RepID=A0A1D2MKD5_ORCCI|nr:hypothetical protein Ocin01_13255 [Orchesella cincta]
MAVFVRTQLIHHNGSNPNTISVATTPGSQIHVGSDSIPRLGLQHATKYAQMKATRVVDVKKPTASVLAVFQGALCGIDIHLHLNNLTFQTCL